MLIKKFRFWQRDKDGTTAIETALLAVPFTFTVLAMVEIALYFATGTVIEGALDDVSRAVRVGQIQNEASISDMEDVFEDTICEHAGILANCANFDYDVRKLTSFSDGIQAEVNDDGNLVNTSFEMDQLTAGCVAMIRVGYLYPFMTPFFGQLFSNYPGNTRLLMSTTVIKTEPFDFEAAENCDI